MEEKNCDHQYESRIKNVTERKCQYLSVGKQDCVTLSQEIHYIFCIKCGDIKKVELSNPK